MPAELVELEPIRTLDGPGTVALRYRVLAATGSGEKS
jgi:hypothetical protein